MPNFLENHRSVSQQSWSLCGVTSWERRSQAPLHHLLQNQAPLSQGPKSGVAQKVKELLGLILPLQGCQVGNDSRMWYQVGETQDGD